MRRTWASLLVVVAAAAAAPTGARAADATDVASAFDAGNPFDLRLRVGYDHSEKRAQIKREAEGLSPTQTTIAQQNDLAYARSRDALLLRLELGLFHDLMFSVELPVILADQQRYAFDGGVGAASSSTVADGLAPAGGFDATRGGAATGGSPLFRGAQRGAAGGSGLDAFDTVGLALTWAPLSQRRDDTKPTWILELAPQISFGNIMAFDRAHPDGNHAVSEGVHRLYARTAISRRWRWLEPYMSFWYMAPIARSDSLYRDYGPAQKTKDPMQQAGTRFGAELIPYERRDWRVTLDVRGRLEGHFAGRGYSEAWELLASSPALACDSVGDHAAFNPACDAKQTTNGYQGVPYTGVTTIENYATLGADFAVGAQLGRWVRLRAAFQYTHDQSHLITGEDIGVPMTATGRVMSAGEYNPAYRAVVDQVGRRFLVDHVDVYDVDLFAQVQF